MNMVLSRLHCCRGFLDCHMNGNYDGPDMKESSRFLRWSLSFLSTFRSEFLVESCLEANSKSFCCLGVSLIYGLLVLIRLSSSSLASCVTTNTSWALVPLRASILKPPVTGIETRNCRPELWPRTLEITPGVIVWISGSLARTFSQGINPST